MACKNRAFEASALLTLTLLSWLWAKVMGSHGICFYCAVSVIGESQAVFVYNVARLLLKRLLAAIIQTIWHHGNCSLKYLMAVIKNRGRDYAAISERFVLFFCLCFVG